MKYECICLAVKDMEAAKQFYQDLMGLEIETDWGENVAFKGGIALQQGFDELIGVPKESVKTRPHNMELVFEAEDFDHFVAKVENAPHVQFVKGGVVEQPWGQRVLHIYDLDGHILEIGENFLHVIQRFVAAGLSHEAVAERCGIPVEDVKKYLDGKW
ncbi:MAG: glyoxalase/bleomycin resistance/dioxygenase family protein [Defluviitaleaceae bacterium]|nr:glyoxalase/bleomycin resistance/dioxygenase family protein [Defluviitaleaceae bacterium]